MQKQLHQHQRSYCEQCQYPSSACICSLVSPIRCQSKLTILQHPSEVKAAKNTARLIRLAIESTTIWVGETLEDFVDAQQSIIQSELPVRVLYPTDHSVEFHQACTQEEGPYHFVLIDGTWKKAYKLWQLNRWLHTLPCINIEGVTSNYHIRKAPAEHCLSTLEAAAFCLEQTEGINCSPLLALFDARQQTFRQYQLQSQQ